MSRITTARSPLVANPTSNTIWHAQVLLPEELPGADPGLTHELGCRIIATVHPSYGRDPGHRRRRPRRQDPRRSAEPPRLPGAPGGVRGAGVGAPPRRELRPRAAGHPPPRHERLRDVPACPGGPRSLSPDHHAHCLRRPDGGPAGLRGGGRRLPAQAGGHARPDPEGAGLPAPQVAPRRADEEPRRGPGPGPRSGAPARDRARLVPDRRARGLQPHGHHAAGGPHRGPDLRDGPLRSGHAHDGGGVAGSRPFRPGGPALPLRSPARIPEPVEPPHGAALREQRAGHGHAAHA